MRRQSTALLILGVLAVQAFGQTLQAPAAIPDPSAAPALEAPAFAIGSTTTGPVFDSAPARLDRWFADAEYLLWWLREGRAPAILTAGSSAGDARVVYGDERLETRHNDRFNGLRLTMGAWLNSESNWAVEAKAFFLERDSTHFKITSAGDTVLAFPYISATTGLPARTVVAGPSPAGILTGGFVGYSRIELFGQELNMTATLADSGNAKVEFLAGARFLEMRDRFDPTAVSRILPDQAILIGVSDHFRTHDFFYGGQGGVRATLVRGLWSLSWRGQAALGGNDQEVRTFAEGTYQTPTVKNVQNTAMFVQPSNLGTFHRDVFDMVFETGFNVAFRLSEHIELFGGYSFLYWANPIRAADQVDTTINTTPGGPARPAVIWREDGFWAQGLNAGVQLHW